MAFVCAEQVQAAPLYRNSIVSTEIDFITDDDPSQFKALTYLGRGPREMPDKRHDKLMDENAYLFKASFLDGSSVEVWAHSSFASKDEAKRYALMLTGPLGKLPELMRKKLAHVVIHKGNETAFGESEGHFFVLYSENMDTRVRHHDLEETVFHESVHATIESKYRKSPAWLSAQKADAEFITEYAAKHPNKEDLPESALFAYTLLKHPGRLASDVEQWIQKHMPNRLAFFQDVFFEADSVQREAGPA